MAYSLIIPIYNEIRVLPELITKLEALSSLIEIIIVDDGSNDGSEKLLNRRSNLISISVVKNKKNLGKGAALKIGVKYATNNNIILADGDLEVDILEIPSLIQRFEKNTEGGILTGVRLIEEPVGVNLNEFGNRIINLFFNKIYNTNYNDILCCIKIMDKKLFKSLSIQSNGFGIEAETMAKLVIKNKTIQQEYIKYNRRTINQGKKLKVSDGWNILWVIIKVKIINLIKNRL